MLTTDRAILADAIRRCILAMEISDCERIYDLKTIDFLERSCCDQELWDIAGDLIIRAKIGKGVLIRVMELLPNENEVILTGDCKHGKS